MDSSLLCSGKAQAIPRGKDMQYLLWKAEKLCFCQPSLWEGTRACQAKLPTAIPAEGYGFSPSQMDEGLIGKGIFGGRPATPRPLD